MDLVQWIVVLTPVSITAGVWWLRDQDRASGKKYAFNPPSGWVVLGWLLGLTLLVWLSTYDTPLTLLGRQREFLHRLGLGSLGLVVLAALLDHILHFFQFSEKVWQRLVTLRIISFQSAVWFSLLHLAMALEVELNWSLHTYYLLSDTRRLGLSAGTITLALMLSSWLIIKLRRISPAIKRRVSLVVYALLVTGGIHAVMIGPDFASHSWYLHFYMIAINTALYLAVARLFAANSVVLKVVAVVAAACILVGSIIVLNTRSQDGPHQHNLNQPINRQFAHTGR